MRAAWVTLVALLLTTLVAGEAAAYHGQPGRAGLVVEGPVDVQGLLTATASPGAALWTYDPTIDAALDAARLEVEVVHLREGRGPLDLLPGERVERERATHEGAQLRLRAPDAAFQLLVHQSGPSRVVVTSDDGGRFLPQPPGGVAPTLDAQHDGLSRFPGADAFLWGLDEAGARLEADSPSVDAVGDFTLFVYDAILRVHDRDGSATYATGRSDDGRGVSYALVHVRGGHLSVAPSEGFVALYGGLLDATLNGTARLERATGSATIGDERVVTSGATALHGVLDAAFTPTSDGERLRMEASGDLAAMAVPGVTREFAPPVAKLSLLLVALGALAWLGKGAALALYSRIAGAKVLEHEERERALALVRERPGLSVADLAEALSVSWSTASYHLGVLEREGMVVSDRAGRHRRYVVVGTGADKAAIAVSSHPTAQALLDAIRAQPGRTQLELAGVAGITASTASWHLKRLAEAGLVTVERKWRSAHYSPA